jgi:hypothetical protein
MWLTDSLLIVNGATADGFVLAAWMPMIQSLGGVLIGGFVTYLVNARNDRRKDSEETRRIALSVAAEVKAGLEAFALAVEISGDMDLADRIESLRYTELRDDYPPITREAARTVGRFPTSMAQLIARYLVLLSNFKQHVDSWRRMHDAGILPDEKLIKRMNDLGPLVRALHSCAMELAIDIDKHYKR